MSAQPEPAPHDKRHGRHGARREERAQLRAARDARVVRSRITARERLGRIVKYHELLLGMIRKELKVKYKNSVLGFAWSLLNPLLYLVVFYVAFSVILGSGVPAFPIWLLSGLLVWNLFSTGLGTATSSVVANAGLVKKVSFPREILPLAAVGSALVHFFLQSLVLFAVLAIVQWHVAWAYIWLLPIALIALLFVTCSLGILLAAVNVYLRDTQHFLELALLAWFWVTPIVYAFQLVVGNKTTESRIWFGRLFMLNPVTPIVIAFQRAIYAKLYNANTNPHTQLLPTWSVWGYLAYIGYAFFFGFIVLAIALRVFGRSEVNFAEEL